MAAAYEGHSTMPDLSSFYTKTDVTDLSWLSNYHDETNQLQVQCYSLLHIYPNRNL